MPRPTIVFCLAIVLSSTTVVALDGLAQTPSKPAVRAEPTGTKAPGTPEAASKPPFDSAYMRLLERTNQQLSLWWNPYGVMVATLGALFAVLAIVAAVLIFRQGREYRSLITRSIVEYQGILNAFIEEKNREVEVMNTRVTAEIERATKDLKTATGAQKNEIEKEIGELKQLKETLKPHERPEFSLPVSLDYSTAFSAVPMSGINSLWNVGSSPYYFSTNLARTHTCARCGKDYNPPAPEKLGTVTIGGRRITCPHCGNIEVSNL